jgi:hypothetical protein
MMEASTGTTTGVLTGAIVEETMDSFAYEMSTVMFQSKFHEIPTSTQYKLQKEYDTPNSEMNSFLCFILNRKPTEIKSS